jgi:hypothetical protein
VRPRRVRSGTSRTLSISTATAVRLGPSGTAERCVANLTSRSIAFRANPRPSKCTTTISSRSPRAKEVFQFGDRFDSFRDHQIPSKTAGALQRPLGLVAAHETKIRKRFLIYKALPMRKVTKLQSADAAVTEILDVKRQRHDKDKAHDYFEPTTRL